MIPPEHKAVRDALREALYSATTDAATALLAKPRESNFKFAAILRPGMVSGKVKRAVVAASSAWFISSVTYPLNGLRACRMGAGNDCSLSGKRKVRERDSVNPKLNMAFFPLVSG